MELGKNINALRKEKEKNIYQFCFSFWNNSRYLGFFGKQI